MSHHPPSIRFPAFYLGSLTAPSGAKVVLEMIAEASTRGRRFAPGIRSLAELVDRSPRTVLRQLAVLQSRGWVRAIRRGKKLTTIYRLSRALWGRLTGRPARPYARPLQTTLSALTGRLAARLSGWEVYTDGPDRAEREILRGTAWPVAEGAARL
ncbi:MAG TPA: hypothetical protein VGX21_08240 [Methylomirabilota bacterium]|nr:hypothetical protein [Methylomirabilota bacterium]